MTREEVQKLLDLPVEERFELAETLWDSLHELPVTDWQREILDERLADLQRNPQGSRSWEEVKARLKQRLAQRE